MKAHRSKVSSHLSNPAAAMNKAIALGAVALWLFSSGCAIHRSEATRTKSFQPFMGEQIDQVDVRSFLSSRVALLIRGNQLPALLNGSILVAERRGSFEAEMRRATAIDRRGYFLTSGELADEDTIYLILKSDTAEGIEQARALSCVEKARVVWSGKPSDGQPDLAILHVSKPLDHVFEWVTNTIVDDVVMAVGLSRSKTNFLGPEFMGGLGLSISKWEGKPSYKEVMHNVPLQNGDSGGPLVTRDGRLLGINCKGELKLYRFFVVPFYWEFLNYAVYPDLGWLSETIEMDAAARSIEHPKVSVKQ
jgi:S1-C subfamily serine protease